MEAPPVVPSCWTTWPRLSPKTCPTILSPSFSSTSSRFTPPSARSLSCWRTAEANDAAPPGSSVLAWIPPSSAGSACRVACSAVPSSTPSRAARSASGMRDRMSSTAVMPGNASAARRRDELLHCVDERADRAWVEMAARRHAPPTDRRSEVHMDVVDLSRFQFASTSIFHFFFVSLTVGLALPHRGHGDHRLPPPRAPPRVYDNMANFFGHLFLINFAVGVVTGIVQEFQFGMNWSEYSRVRRQHLRRAAGARGADGVLPGEHLHRAVVVRQGPAAAVGAPGEHLAGGDRHADQRVLDRAGQRLDAPSGRLRASSTARRCSTSFTEVVLNYKAWLYFAARAGQRAGRWRPSSCWRSAPTTCCAAATRGVLPLAADRAGVRRDRHAVLRHQRAHRRRRPTVRDQPMKFAAMEAQWETSESPAPWSRHRADQRAGAAQQLQPGDPLHGLAARRTTTSRAATRA